jgi:hypothetical protein
MKKLNALYITLFITMLSLAAAAQRSTPKAVVEAFYRFDQTHSQNFDRRNIEARKPWFSTELYLLLLNELKRDAAYLKKNPTDKPYFGDGLPFQPLQENCRAGKGRRMTIRQEFQKGARAVTTVTFAYPKPCKETDAIVYTIGLTRTRKGWAIDDINYGEDTTLKQRLRRKEY